MKRKTNKKSGIIAAVVGLSAVSLVSVGFASWVMSGGDSASITDGQISVETVDDQRFLIMKEGTYAPAVDYGKTKKAGGQQNATSICFGIDDSTPITNAWLTAATGDAAASNKYENLSATVIFYVANLASVEDVTDVVTAELAVVDNSSNGWAHAVGEKYVAPAPTDLVPVIPTTGDNLTYTDPTTGLVYTKVTAAINFGWGTKFNYDDPEDDDPAAPVNPYVFFNKTMTNSIEDTTTAKGILDQLAKDLAGVKFEVTITTTVA